VTLDIRQIHPLFVGEVRGIDLRLALDAATVGEIIAALDRHAVLVFRGQDLEPRQQIAFAQNLGPLYLGLRKIHQKKVHRYDEEAVSDISNVNEDGSIAERDSLKMYTMLANQLWHSDGSFQRDAARYSTLHCVVNPPGGSVTEFADERAAYDALPDDFKKRLEGLRAEHFGLHSRIALGYDGYSEEDRRKLPPVDWPVVRVHSGSGRKTLYIGAHTTRILEMHLAEGKLLLAELLEHTTQREFVYRHDWRVGDLLIWDNRSTLHRGLRYELSERRELRRVSTYDPEFAVSQAA
jgi:alpha-ketoglutarate-dependent 2,4-dichlorophenoxyacetate dioxygenase